MSTVPRLSIGLPVYNGEDYLAESLDALLGQSYEDFELVIADNASTDGTADICRRYAKQDSRIRYFRQPRNLGLAGNRSFVIEQARGELYKEASHDDLYARDLLRCCIDALDEYPQVVLAHSWTAAIDGNGDVTQALDYPLATDSPRAPERFRSMLFGSDNDYGLIRSDDEYGVMRTAVLRRVAPLGSYYHADKTLMAEIVLHGPFHQTSEWLYFRRDHPDRAQHAHPTIRTWCTNLDPRRANPIRNPTALLIAEYIWGYVAAIRRAPLSTKDRQECFGYLARWVAGRTLRARDRRTRETAPVPPPTISVNTVDAVVPGRERAPS